jgi:hypothetical protein
MQKTKTKLNENYNRIRELRPIIAPNLIFMSQLTEFERELLPSLHNNSLISGLESCANAFRWSSSVMASCNSLNQEEKKLNTRNLLINLGSNDKNTGD